MKRIQSLASQLQNARRSRGLATAGFGRCLSPVERSCCRTQSGYRHARKSCASQSPFCSQATFRTAILKLALALALLVGLPCAIAAGPADTPDKLAWPEITKEQRPWAYWWWMGSAVDKKNITLQLETFHKAGMGGVHIIPIYGAKGYESRYIEFLSPQWMEMLAHSVSEAHRLGMDIDMTAGTGWCFGGPNITRDLANARMRSGRQKLEAGASLEKPLPEGYQAVVALGPDESVTELTDRVGADGRLDWKAPEGGCTVYWVWQTFSGRTVKRAAPGGEGPMLNPFYGRAIRHYLERFDKAFADYKGEMPRAIYHDSYEYVCDWSPDLFDEFERRRGYRLQSVLPQFLGEGDKELTARIKGDYRLTVSDMMTDNFTQTYVDWGHKHGCIVRNEAHGSPGNLLDLYGVVDVPETEFFRFDRNPLVAKFASSASHVTGHRLVACESGTWLTEHFHVTLGHLKPFIDGLFVSGINHVVYHGNCYSPEDAPWPGWLFYASTQMNPRNAIWHDVPALNAYFARCQSILQAGKPDNDVLVYWPIHDMWHEAGGMARMMTVHTTDWLTKQTIGDTARALWQRGFGFDYVSDRQIQETKAAGDGVEMPGGVYRVVLVPPSRKMPVETFRTLLDLAAQGATVAFQERLPDDVPGYGRLDARLETFRSLWDKVRWTENTGTGPKVLSASIGKGRFLLGENLEALMATAGVERESLVDREGLLFIRRRHDAGRYYFIINQGEQFPPDPQTPAVDGWLPLATPARSAAILDPMTGRSGVAAVRRTAEGGAEVYLQLQAGQSIILRTFEDRRIEGPAWPYGEPTGQPSEIKGSWKVKFVQGGPELPKPFETGSLESWTKLGGEDAESFAGTGRYAIAFDAPSDHAGAWRLDLGRVAESAQVRLNGRDLGPAFCQPFQVVIPAGVLKPTGNQLEIGVTNLSANRIRDLDRRGVEWRYFNDINFVNIDYKRFDASNWPVLDSGLLGPVTLIALHRKEL